MISRGLTPSEIARDLDVSSSSILGYLQTAVGKGLIRRSDIYFTLRLETRPSPTTREDDQVVAHFGSVADAMGDMYADLAHIEVSLHSKIRFALEQAYGSGKREWWLRLPLEVRNKCNERCEEDSLSFDPYCYTDLLDLKRGTGIAPAKQLLHPGRSRFPLLRSPTPLSYGESTKLLDWQSVGTWVDADPSKSWSPWGS